MQKEEESNKWFPQSNSAKEVRDKLLKKSIDCGVEVLYDKLVVDVVPLKDRWICKMQSSEEIVCDKIILASGGLSIPLLVGQGPQYGFSITEKLGAKVEKLFPALTPLKGAHPGGSSRGNYLQGVSLPVDLLVTEKTGRLCYDWI